MMFAHILTFWLVTQLFNLVGFPIAFRLFKNLPDRGYAFSRPLGLLLVAYLLWLTGSFGLLRNNLGGALLALFIVGGLGLFWAGRGRNGNLLAWLKANLSYVLTVEVIFAVAFVGWAVFKSYNPNIETAGGEKWMEIAFVNASLNSPSFPPQDPWLSGFGISYYYFGYLMMAILTRLSGIVPTTAFNLFIPTLFGLTLIGAFGIVANLVATYKMGASAGQQSGEAKRGLLSAASLGPGLLGALFVGVMGHWEGVLEVLHARGLLSPAFWRWLDIRDLKVPPQPPFSWIPTRFIWWWRGSRVLTDYTLTGQEQEVIDEFPFFSFMLGDVHPHVLALPFVLLAIGLALNLLLSKKAGERGSGGAGETRGQACPEYFGYAQHKLAEWGDKETRRQGDKETRAGGQEDEEQDTRFALRTIKEFSSQRVRDPRLTLDKSAGSRNRLERTKAWEATPHATRNNLPISQSPNLPFTQGVTDLITAAGGRTAFFLYALCIGGLGFLNTWDFPVYLAVLGLAFLAWRGLARLGETMVGMGVFALLGVLLYLPFYIGFQSQAGGILPNLWNPTRLPQFAIFFGPFLAAAVAYLLILSGRESWPWRQNLGWSFTLTLLGPVTLLAALVLAFLILPAGRGFVQRILTDPAVQAALGGAALNDLLREIIHRRVSTPWTFLLLGGLSGLTLAHLWGSVGAGETRRQGDKETRRQGDKETRRQACPEPAEWGGKETRRQGDTPHATRNPVLSEVEGTQHVTQIGGRRPGLSEVEGPAVGGRAAEIFVLILLLMGLLLPLAVEFVFLKDLFNNRMNTVFKFYFQAWVLLALASAFSVYYVTQNLRGLKRIAWEILVTLMILGGMVYPVLAIPNKANDFQAEPTLDGIAWVAVAHPDDYAAIQWLRQNAPPNAVILERPGKSYRYLSRMSALTGRPTLLGWDFHEAQWRGNYDEQSIRQPDIEMLYNGLDPVTTLTLLDKYDINYVVVGSLERQVYNPNGLAKFERLMDVAFAQGNVVIYRR